MEVPLMNDSIVEANLLSAEKVQQKKELTDVAEFLVSRMQLKDQMRFTHITVFEGDIPNNPLTIAVIRGDAMTIDYVLYEGFELYKELMKKKD